jgi:hypothetical protein
LGINQSPAMYVGYLGIALVLYACAKLATIAPKPAETEHAQDMDMGHIPAE